MRSNVNVNVRIPVLVLNSEKENFYSPPFLVLVISCSQHKWPASSDVDAADHDGDHEEDDDDHDEDDDDDSHPKEGSETPRALEGQVFSTLFSIAACITIIGHDQNGGEHVWRFDDDGRMLLRSLACFFGGIFEFLRRKWQRSRSLIRPEASLDFLI